jgi:hypothetical protein
MAFLRQHFPGRDFFAWWCGVASSVTRPVTLWLLFMGLHKSSSLHRQTTYSWSPFQNHNARNSKGSACHAWKEYWQFRHPSTRMPRQKWTAPNWCDFSQLIIFSYVSLCILKWQCTSNVRKQ